MAIKSQQLRQSFLISGAGTAVLLVVLVAWLVSNRVGRILEQQADVRGRDVATRVAAIVTQYLKERHREVVSLASMPQLITRVRQAGQEVRIHAGGQSRLRRRRQAPELVHHFAGDRTCSTCTEAAILDEHGNGIHSAVYLADDVVFTKNGNN